MKPHLRSSNVSTSSTKTLSEGPHVDVNILWVSTIVVHYTSTPWPQRTYAVGLINIQVSLQGRICSHRYFSTNHEICTLLTQQKHSLLPIIKDKEEQGKRHSNITETTSKFIHIRSPAQFSDHSTSLHLHKSTHLNFVYSSPSIFSLTYHSTFSSHLSAVHPQISLISNPAHHLSMT